MKCKLLTEQDCLTYANDILDCYKTNKLVLDSQSPLSMQTKDQIVEFVSGYVRGLDSEVIGIFDNNYLYCYGIIIFDNIRFNKENSIAEVHIVTSKSIWGKKARDIYSKVIESMYYDTLYCMIPQIAVHAINLCKRLGFKKTGYIPKAIPYVNSKGEEHMYDYIILTLEYNKSDRRTIRDNNSN